jgi:hypothetical protein
VNGKPTAIAVRHDGPVSSVLHLVSPPPDGRRVARHILGLEDKNLNQNNPTDTNILPMLNGIALSKVKVSPKNVDARADLTRNAC